MTEVIQQNRPLSLQTSDVLVCAHIYFVSKWKCPQGVLFFFFAFNSFPLTNQMKLKNLDQDYTSCNTPTSCQCETLS